MPRARKRRPDIPMLRDSRKQLREEVAEALLSLANEVIDDTRNHSEYVEPLTKEIGCQVHCLFKDSSTQTDDSLLSYETQKLKRKVSSLQEDRTILQEKMENLKQRPLNVFEETIRENDSMCKFYTGLVFPQILILFSFLGDAVNNLKYWGKKYKGQLPKGRPKRLSLIQELIFVLLRLRTGLLVSDISYRFNLSTGFITSITTTWIQLMYHEFKDMSSSLFPARSITEDNMPSCFKKFKGARLIIDCAEFFTQLPENFDQQGNLYSQYKAHTTCKVLIGCSPNGTIVFTSELYEGSISDKELFVSSGIIDLLEPGDLVIADRGFTVGEVLASKGVHLNIPPFLNGREKLTPQEEALTKRIAKVRIFVEHAVGKLKQFRLLTKVLPLSMRGILSQMVYVTSMLVNFQESYIK